MKTEGTIIRHFLGMKEAVTIRELSRRIRSDYRITYTAVQRLIEKGVLHATTVGKSTLCQLAPRYYGPEIYLAEEERKERALQDKDLRRLREEVVGRMGTSFFVSSSSDRTPKARPPRSPTLTSSSSSPTRRRPRSGCTRRSRSSRSRPTPSHSRKRSSCG